jgi:homoserine kinase
MLRERVTVSVPATSANMGPGFDSLGLALEIRERITVSFSGDHRPPSEDPLERMVQTAARAFFERMNVEQPANVSASHTTEVPLGRGLGASAIARVGGILAANEAAGRPASEGDLLEITAGLEGHGDNAAPALLGGMQVVVQARDRFLHLEVPVPETLQAVVLVPDLSMPTREARRVMPRSHRRADAVFNLSRAALLVAAMYQGRLDLLGEATQDRIHQPARAQLFPPLFDVIRGAREAGAAAAWLSGAGSCVLALTETAPEAVGRAMEEASIKRGYPATFRLTKPSRVGAVIQEE